MLSVDLAQMTYVIPQPFVEGMPCEGGDAAENDELHAGTGNGDVHTAQVTKEANLSILVRTYQGDDDHVALLPLESVNGGDGDQVTEGLEEFPFFTKCRRYCTWAR